jgi:GxxExxY protein
MGKPYWNKAITNLNNTHRAQAINYLAITGYQLALLLNFGTLKLQQVRLVRLTASVTK